MWPIALARLSGFIRQGNVVRAIATNVRSGCDTSNDFPPISSTFDLSNLKHSLGISVPPSSRAPPPIGLPVREIKIPFIRRNSLEDPVSKMTVEDPLNVIEQRAARMIVIRRKKMKRHKLRKLRKRMRFAWAKVRQKREMKKEKDFHVEIMSQIRTAEKFSAKAYVEEKIFKSNQVFIPKLWKGKRLPQFVIEDLLQKSKMKQQEFAKRQERRKSIFMNVSDCKV